MQDEGALCQKCGALLAPGWGQLLGELNEIAPGPRQSAIMMKQSGRESVIISDDSDEENEEYDVMIIE